MNMSRVTTAVTGLVASALLLSACGSAKPASSANSSSEKAASAVTVKDVAGREVTFEKLPEKVALGESRAVYGTMILNKDKPLDKVVAWGNDLKANAPDLYERVAKKAPEAKDLPVLGAIPKGDLSVEGLLTYNPDVYVMSLDAWRAGQKNGTLEKFEKAGIKYVVTDFRIDPVKNTEKSMKVLGQVLGREKKADEFLEFYRKAVDPVREQAEKAKEKPSFLLWRAPGAKGCCATWKNSNFAAVLNAAGGQSIADPLLSGESGDITAEQVIASQPQEIVATGGDWGHKKPDAKSKTGYLNIGYNTSAEEARTSLRALAQQPGFAELDAFRNGSVHGLYHQFYDGPFNFIVYQLFSQWSFGKTPGIDPEKTWAEFHERFMPFPAEGAMWVDIEEGKS